MIQSRADLFIYACLTTTLALVLILVSALLSGESFVFVGFTITVACRVAHAPFDVQLPNSKRR